MHPIARQAYIEANFDIPITVAENKEQWFKQKTQGSRIERRVDQVYRTRVGGDRDYIWYRVTDIGEDYLGNQYTWEHEIGRYEYPLFNRVFDQATNRPVVSGKRGNEMVYEIPFSKRNMNAVLNDRSIMSETVFTLDTGSVRYGGPFKPKDFIERSFEDLYYMCSTPDHKFPDVPTPVESDEDVARFMQEQRILRAQRRKKNSLMMRQTTGGLTQRALMARPLSDQKKEITFEDESLNDENTAASPTPFESESTPYTMQNIAPDAKTHSIDEAERQSIRQEAQQSNSNMMMSMDVTEKEDLSDIPAAILNQSVAITKPNTSSPPSPQKQTQTQAPSTTSTKKTAVADNNLPE